MYGIIASPQSLATIKKALGEEAPLFEHVGPFAAEEIRSVLQTVSFVARQAIIIDLACGPEKEIVNGLSLFRQQKPHTRVIVLAIGRKPGDPTVSAIAEMGITDIVAPEKASQDVIVQFLSKQLNFPSDNADKWIVNAESPRQSEVESVVTMEKPQPKPQKPTTAPKSAPTSTRTPANPPRRQVEKVVVRDRMIGQSTIAFASASPGCGSTYTAIQAAAFLRQYFKNILVLELIDEESMKQPALSSYVDREDTLFTIDKLKGVEFAFTTRANNILRLKKWDWVIIDIGHMIYRDSNGAITYNLHADELARATVGCVMTTGSVWGYDQLERFIQVFGDKRMDWNIMVNFSDHDQRNNIYSNLHEYSWSGEVRIFGMPFQPNLYSVSEDSASMWNRLLQQFIPQEEEREKHFLSKFLGKGK